ncbi:Stage II sporulation protein M [uncultured archaeon]|nr:Stage II sporulation protein M [uncultured archaeon]
MIELFVKPKRAERKPSEMFLIGLLYSSISLLLVSFVFSKDGVLGHYGGILVVTFTVLCTLPFMYYIIKLEEGKDVEISEEGELIKEHTKALKALMWLFLGLVVGFSFWYLVLPNATPQNFNAQIEVFCSINSPNNYQNCLDQNGVESITGSVTKPGLFWNIFANNVNVLIFTLVFSLALGAGAIFILAWNASVIGTAVGMFAKAGLASLPLGLLRYMIHGIPEIAAYFVSALAGGIVSVAVIRGDLEGERKWSILQDALVLIVIALVILFLSALVEVYITPQIMGFVN